MQKQKSMNFCQRNETVLNEFLQIIIVALVLAYCVFYVIKRFRSQRDRKKCDEPDNDCVGCDADCPLRKIKKD